MKVISYSMVAKIDSLSFKSKKEKIGYAKTAAGNVSLVVGIFGPKADSGDVIFKQLEALSKDTINVRNCYSIHDLLTVINEGGVAIVKNTHQYWHPDIEALIIDLFRDKEVNKNNAQLFFSSYNVETFDLLWEDQIVIIDNGEATKVSDYKLPKNANIKAMYRRGDFGGLPDTIDLQWQIHNLLCEIREGKPRKLNIPLLPVVVCDARK